MNQISDSPIALLVIDAQIGFTGSEASKTSKAISHLVQSALGAEVPIIFTRFVNDESSPFVKQMGWSEMMPGDGEVDFSCTPPECAITIEKSTYGIDVEELAANVYEDSIVLITGFDSEACVLVSAFKIFDAGWTIRIVEDAIGSSGGETYHSSALQIMKRSFGESSVISSRKAEFILKMIAH